MHSGYKIHILLRQNPMTLYLSELCDFSYCPPVRLSNFFHSVTLSLCHSFMLVLFAFFS
jgi:hypothetical protein